MPGKGTALKGRLYSVMAGLVPAIHDLLFCLPQKTWMPATSAGMTTCCSPPSSPASWPDLFRPSTSFYLPIERRGCPGGPRGGITVTLRCERSEPRRATAEAFGPYPSRAASRPPQDDGVGSAEPNHDAHRPHIDADACPVKQEIYRVAERHAGKGVRLKVFVVSNSPIAVPRYLFCWRRPDAKPAATFAGRPLIERVVGRGLS